MSIVHIDYNQNSQHWESHLLPFLLLSPNKECLFSENTNTHTPQVMCQTDIITPTLTPSGTIGQGWGKHRARLRFGAQGELRVRNVCVRITL